MTPSALRLALAALAAVLLAAGPPAAARDDDWPAAAKAPAEVKPGQTRLLTAPKGMTYFLRVPKDYDAKKGARLVVWLHGSNMNGMQYVASFEGRRWCVDDLLVCPNGETTADAARHIHNFTEQSGPLVEDLTREVQKAFKVSVTYVGGHSQGAFLTYNCFLTAPDVYQGAMPFAGGMWMRNEPNLWETEERAFAKQRAIPVAVIHGRDDGIVPFSTGELCYDLLRTQGWTRLRLFDPPDIGHMFAPAPIDHALAWLDALNGREEKRSLDLLDDWLEAGEWSWAIECAEALAAAPGASPAAKAAPARAAKAAAEPSKKAAAEMQASLSRDEPSVWIPKWLGFRRVFGATAAARPLVQRYDGLRDKERAEAGRLFSQSQAAFRSERPDDAYAALEELVEQAPHSYEATYAVRWLAERATKEGGGGKSGKKRKKGK